MEIVKSDIIRVIQIRIDTRSLRNAVVFHANDLKYLLSLSYRLWFYYVWWGKIIYMSLPRSPVNKDNGKCLHTLKMHYVLKEY